MGLANFVAHECNFREVLFEPSIPFAIYALAFYNISSYVAVSHICTDGLHSYPIDVLSTSNDNVPVSTWARLFAPYLLNLLLSQQVVYIKIATNFCPD